MQSLRDEIEKETKKGDDSPKERFIFRMAIAVLGQKPKVSPENALNSLLRKVLSKHWTTILKALYVTHRLIPQMGSAMNQELTRTSFPVKQFRTKRGGHHNELIQTYIEFIRLSSLNYSNAESLFLSECITEHANFHLIESILVEFNLLTQILKIMDKIGRICLMSIEIFKVELVKAIFDWVLHDICSTYKKTRQIMDFLIEKFYFIDKKLAKHVFKSFENFDEFCVSLDSLYEDARRYFLCSVNKPNLVLMNPEKSQEIASYIRSISPSVFFTTN